MSVDTNKAAVTSSFPVLSILGIVFVTLKLIGEIGWSWWWVLAPFWAPWAIFFVVLLAFALVYGVYKVVTNA